MQLEQLKRAEEIQQTEETVHQRVSHSVLRNVEYRINVWMSTPEFYEALKQQLEYGRSYYTPTLGLSEYIASITYHGEFTPEPVSETKSSEVQVNSIVPKSAGDIGAVEGVRVVSEQTPAEMRYVEDPFSNRRTTAYTTYKYRNDGEVLPVTTEHAATVNGNTVIFK
mgnify:CR=1 FL=1